MSPEAVTKSSFIQGVIDARPMPGSMILRLLPGATKSFLSEVWTYRSIYRHTDALEREILETGPAMLVTLWAYTVVSDRPIAQLHQEGLLLPAVGLYRTVVAQDDILDNARKNGPIPAEDAFWHTQDGSVKVNPSEAFDTLAQFIDLHPSLTDDAKRYMAERIFQAYVSYTKAEDALAKLANSEYTDIYTIHALKAESYGLMQRAVSAILNGNECMTEQSMRIEEKMAWFQMLTDILDGELDKEEDRPYTVTLPLVADAFDRLGRNPQGHTTEKLLQYYFSHLSEPSIAALLIVLRAMYPRAERMLRSIEPHMNGRFSRLVLNRDGR